MGDKIIDDTTSTIPDDDDVIDVPPVKCDVLNKDYFATCVYVPIGPLPGLHKTVQIWFLLLSLVLVNSIGCQNKSSYESNRI